MKLGIEVLLQDQKKIKHLKSKKVALVCHPASINHKFEHSIDLISKKLKLSSAFGPQHGIKGEKQDNMVESEDYLHPQYHIPIYSLYGQVRRPSKDMMKSFDILLFDLQDVGCRIYTFITTLLYMMEECARFNKTLLVLDRPNPAGREIEGLRLLPGWESFVGAAPIPMRHGLTLGELALYFKDFYNLDLDLQIIKMQSYKISQKPGWGWPMDLAWINPSPNAANLNMARAYAGTVLLEGTHLSEGRGTTRPLELFGAAEIDFSKVLQLMRKKGSSWLQGAHLRECFFEPTFHKYAGKLCHGLQIHTDWPGYQPQKFKPYRLVALMLKCLHELYPDYEIYRQFNYEYIENRLPFDSINGGPRLREWIDDIKQTPLDLQQDLFKDEKSWLKESKKYRLYK